MSRNNNNSEESGFESAVDTEMNDRTSPYLAARASAGAQRYPLPCPLAFVPGGVTYAVVPPPATTTGATATATSSGTLPPLYQLNTVDESLLRSAQQSDDRLRQYSLWYQSQQQQPSSPSSELSHRLPSLGYLAERVFGRLNGCPPDMVKAWANALVLSQYHGSVDTTTSSTTSTTSAKKAATADDSAAATTATTMDTDEAILTPDQIWATDPVSPSHSTATATTTTVPALLASFTTNDATHTTTGRPCGYVFKRGDIAWNCRTCQADPTCVVCDDCFRESDHEGHEVYFHRTTPGGCCDCGDAEAWAYEGCCPKHRPPSATPITTCPMATTPNDASGTNSDSNSNDPQPPILSLDDPLEAVRTAATARTWAEETLSTSRIPPRLLAALGVVIGAAVECLLDTVDGSGAGADALQWTRRWSDEAAKVTNGVACNEDFYYRAQQQQQQGRVRGNVQQAPVSLTAFLRDNKVFPENLRMHLRLHNDDVHTFDEVIDALHEPRLMRRNSEDHHPSLVSLRENATDMTHHVDADGQVTVKTYNNVAAALRGFRRLKSRGLHCAVVSTAQVDAELRARALTVWLTDVAASHVAAQALVVHALVQLPNHALAGIHTDHPVRALPAWAVSETLGVRDAAAACHIRFAAFPPHQASSYVTREEAELLHGTALALLDRDVGHSRFTQWTGAALDFYAKVPYRLPSARYHKSPHCLYGTLPSEYSDPVPVEAKHPLLEYLVTGRSNVGTKNRLTESVYVVDTDLRKQQEGERITLSVYPHKLPGLHVISGIGMIRAHELNARRPPLPSPMDLRHLLATSSFRAPLSPILLLLLLDPYPTKQVRGSVHALFLSLLTNPRFKSRFAGALAIAYRPLSTLFCAGVGTEADTPLHFTVQIFTAGSIVRALLHGPATEKLLVSDQPSTKDDIATSLTSIGVFVPSIAHIIVRCIHTNLLGATKEVNMILNNTSTGGDDNSHDEGSHQQHGNTALLPALTYVAGEHPLMTPLPAAPDDGFLDSRSTRHKRLPHLLRDLDYVIETPVTALRLLLPNRFAVYQGQPLSLRGEDVLTFPAVFSRMLRLAQGMDPQKRKISGGHVEYEQNRWLEAFGLSLNFGGTRDALAESPCGANNNSNPNSNDGTHLLAVREAMGNIVASLLREVKLWLYREGMLETGLPVSPGGAHGGIDLAQVEALQRSTLHVSSSQYDESSASASDLIQGASSSVALSCATGVKMTEAQLTLIENALKVEAAQRLEQRSSSSAYGVTTPARVPLPSTGPVVGDWLRVPHSPLAGDSLSFHLPLHRALAKCVRSLCSVVVPEDVVAANPDTWWKLPVLDDFESGTSTDPSTVQHPLVPLIRSTLRSSNCRVVWSAGPDCTTLEAQRRRSRSRTVSANIAVAKVIHSLADHPIRCLAAAQQIERHMWARNGNSVAGMAMNYSSAPLCRSFRDLDLLLVQLSAAGMSCGLGSRRVLSLLLSRFSMDGYLCDPERRAPTGGSAASLSSQIGAWVNPPRLQDQEHAVVLAESFFSTVCVLVTELPGPPPTSSSDDSSLRRSIRRELLHALAAEPRSHSEAMSAATSGISSREESEGTTGKGGSGGLFRSAFATVLREVGKQKNQGSSRAASGPPAFELKAEFCDEYDPTFFHLRRQEHQHAMDVVARLRKQKWGKNSEALDTHCLPVVCTPPKAHPRFLPCRLLLHLESMDAGLRRTLLFALTNGSWLPPPEPLQKSESINGPPMPDGVEVSVASTPGSLDVPLTTFNRRIYQSQSSSISTFPSRPEPIAFSAEVVATSSVSFLEVLQLLTLQVHTLEECASLHRLVPDLDDESRSLSSGLSINSYLSRLVAVPDSLTEVWALRPYPAGPLKSKGSGDKRGSILGLLIALYEHRADHGAILNDDGGDYGQSDEDHGGSRSLASSGLKWLLRFVNALVDGAPSVGAAVKSATTGVPLANKTAISPSGSDAGSSTWSINEEVTSTIRGMLKNLLDLWPKPPEKSSSPEKSSAKSKEARKAAQLRVMEMMKRKQAAFAATIAPKDSPSGKARSGDETDQETDLCIICRCDDADGENNGPLGYLGHVQRSRIIQMRSTVENMTRDNGKPALVNSYRVVGHMGCQLRETEAMDSRPLSCLPKGSVVSVLKSKVSAQYDIQSRRVLVRHITKDSQTDAEIVTEGWASMQSSQGYVILSPLVSLCYSNSRWGCTRPIIKQCGHAAHLKCVETHTLSLHQRALGDQHYDGRFAANINDGEYLCPLCKQLSNILIPRDRPPAVSRSSDMDIEDEKEDSSTKLHSPEHLRRLFVSAKPGLVDNLSPLARRALEDYGAQLHNAMNVPWERSTIKQTKKQEKWHPAIQKWDFEEDIEEPDGDTMASQSVSVKHLLRLFRQQLVSWAAVGHSAAALEAGARGVEEVLPFGAMSVTSDPWPEYGKDSQGKHSMLLELKRTLTGSSGLLEILLIEMSRLLANRAMKANEATVVGSCLADILYGRSWVEDISVAAKNNLDQRLASWSEVAALVASTPSHVSRDGTIAQRCEARAAASAMWTIRGLPCDFNKKTEPPPPLAIRQLFAAENSRHPKIPSDWGTMLPFVVDGDTASARSPFRPAAASGFLYTPLLAWDLYTYSGAVLSCILLNDDQDLPSSNDLLQLAQTLMVARIVQAIVTPRGFDIPDECDLDDEDCWSVDEVSREGPAIAQLLSHCRFMVNKKSLELPDLVLGESDEKTSARLLAGIGRAILPFSRALTLMLRACTAVVQERQGSNMKVRQADDYVSALCNEDIMAVEDGFHFVKVLKCPLPSTLIDPTSGQWFNLINRWIISTIGLELHHGSMGNSIFQTVAARSSSHEDVSNQDTAPREKGNPEHVFSDESSDDMAMEIDAPAARDTDRVGAMRRGNDDLMIHGDDSDEELADSMDEAEEMVSFDLVDGATFNSRPTVDSNDDAGDSDYSSSGVDEGVYGLDIKFANVSRSPILPYQPSVLAIEGIGPGRHGSLFEYSIANEVMSDLSHLGLVHRKESSTFTLLRLPKSFVELYNIVNKVKGRDDASAMEESDEGGSSETAICLLTGAVMRSGSTRRVYSRAARPPGACTLHARKTASGIGIFFLVQKCTVLLMHNNKSAYSPSLFVDEHGEEDPQLRRGRPLFLNEARYRALESLWRQQGIPREVAQIRSTSDRVIRDNWY